MYRGFNLSLGADNAVIRGYAERGAAVLDARWPRVEKDLSALLDADSIDGEEVMKAWFKQVSADVFISHSHRDLALARGLAGYLHDELGLVAFVDSQVWLSADGLLEAIDKRYCRSDGEEADKPVKSYNYKKRNYSTSHVHMMLAASISEAIDRSECIIFLNTPQSIKASDAEADGKAKTGSPWIYHELNTSRLIRRQEPTRKRLVRKGYVMEHYAFDEASAPVPLELPAPVAHLARIDGEDVFNWRRTVKQKDATALDALYWMVPDPQPELIRSPRAPTRSS
ncbi:hypothetical protein [Xanthomonas sp. NCPPB 2632]|uniref:hypothetical protein n=1 Tax=Xanthomonas sp. NCPPB 2632 TaxID=3240912 RepID=UPI0035121269